MNRRLKRMKRLTAGLAWAAGAACGAEMPCAIFPSNSIWNTRVDILPVHPASAAFIASIGSNTGFHADFGAGLWEGGPIGIPFVVVPSHQPKVEVDFEYADESDPGPYPIPPDPPIEGGPASTGDRHILMVDAQGGMLYELYSAYTNADGSWRAGSGAIFDLASHALRSNGWTSADAAGLPILPGLVRYEEVAAGEIRHAIRFTVSRTRRAYVWPARHYASSYTQTNYPPMGQRFRLRRDFDISGFSNDVKVILRAMKTYGIILADNGSNWYLSGAPDERWNNDHLQQMKNVHGRDMEAVDACVLQIHPDSGEARSPIPGIRHLRISGAQASLGLGNLLSNVGYRVEAGTGLAAGAWQEVGRFTGAADQREWTGAVDGARRFYRLAVE